MDYHHRKFKTAAEYVQKFAADIKYSNEAANVAVRRYFRRFSKETEYCIPKMLRLCNIGIIKSLTKHFNWNYSVFNVHIQSSIMISDVAYPVHKLRKSAKKESESPTECDCID